MNLTDYKKLTIKLDNSRLHDQPDVDAINNSIEELVTDISNITGNDHGWIKTSDGSIFYYDIKVPELEYFSRTLITDLTTIGGSVVDLIEVNKKVLRHHQNMFNHIKSVEPPILHHPDNNETLYSRSTVLLTSPFKADSVFLGGHNTTEYEVSKDKGFKFIYKSGVLTENLYSIDLELPENSILYVRCRFTSGNYITAYSNTVVLTTGTYSQVARPSILLYDKNKVHGSLPSNYSRIPVSNIVTKWSISTDSNFLSNETVTITDDGGLSIIELSPVLDTVRYIRLRYIIDGKVSEWSDPFKLNLNSDSYIEKPSITSTEIGIDRIIASTPYSNINGSGIYMGTEWSVSRVLEDDTLSKPIYVVTSSSTSPIGQVSTIGTHKVKCRHIDSDKNISLWSDTIDLEYTDIVELPTVSSKIHQVNNDFLLNSFVIFYKDPNTVSDSIKIEVIIKNNNGSIVEIKSKDVLAADVGTDHLAISLFDNNKYTIGKEYIINARAIIDGSPTRYINHRGTLRNDYNNPYDLTPKPGNESDTRYGLTVGSTDMALTVGGNKSDENGIIHNGIWTYKVGTDSWSYLGSTNHSHASTVSNIYYDIPSATLYIVDEDPSKSEIVDILSLSKEKLVMDTHPDETSTLYPSNGHIFKLNSSELYYFGGYKEDGSLSKEVWRKKEEGWVLVDILDLVPDSIVVKDNIVFYSNITDEVLSINAYMAPVDGYATKGTTTHIPNNGLLNVSGELLVYDHKLYYVYTGDDNITYVSSYEQYAEGWDLNTTIPVTPGVDTHRSIIINGNLLVLTRSSYTNGVGLKIK